MRKSQKCPPELFLLPEPIPFLGEIRGRHYPSEQEDSPIQFDCELFIIEWNVFVRYTEDNICPSPKKAGKTATGM